MKEETLFYTDLIDIFIEWLFSAITEANSGSIWKSLVAYQEIIIASEYIGRERGYGVTFYANGGFRSRDDYLLFVEAQDIANVTFKSCRRYSEIAYNAYENEVLAKENILRPMRRMRYEIRSNRSSSPNGSLALADWWFENMTVYQDIIRDAQKKIAEKIDKRLEERSEEDLRSIIIICSIFGSILIMCPILILAVYYLTSQIQSYSINIANRLVHHTTDCISLPYPYSLPCHFKVLKPASSQIVLHNDTDHISHHYPGSLQFTFNIHNHSFNTV